MCGRFTQYNSREEYLAFLGEEAERAAPAGLGLVEREVRLFQQDIGIPAGAFGHGDTNAGRYGDRPTLDDEGLADHVDDLVGQLPGGGQDQSLDMGLLGVDELHHR